MFILKDMPTLRSELSAKVEACKKECAALEEKRTHVETAYKKVQEDFQEFVNAHLVDENKEGDEKKKVADAD